MEQILEMVKNIDLENFDFMAILNSIMEIVKSLLSSFLGDKEEA